MHYKTIALSSFMSLAVFAQTNSIPLGKVWAEINASSPAQEASLLQANALTETKNRASRHWLPRFYLDARAYQTNDPGDNFFGLLEQRSLQQSDFDPATINTPGTHTYQRGAIGLDLPLYEGGMKVSQVDMLTHAVNAQENSTNQVQIEQYSQVALSYGAIGVLAQEQLRFQALKSEIEHLKKSYKLGNKSNPVGYSGLLGIESLENRLNGFLNQYAAESRAYYSALREMGLKQVQWEPVRTDTRSYVDTYFLGQGSKAEVANSFKMKSLRENVMAGEEASNMEKARFLPRVGAFAETYKFNGGRADATGYNAGVYVRWSLFDPADFGTLSEAKTKALAAKKYSEAMEQQERAERAGLSESIRAYRENIVLLDDSYKILIEQSKITEKLFQSGAINALQIVEILNRRAELISQHCEAELGLVKAAAQSVTKEQFDIAQHLAGGVKNEK
jgi:outer membrane protein TolC